MSNHVNRQHDLNLLFVVFALKNDHLSQADFRNVLSKIDEYNDGAIGKSLVDSNLLNAQQQQHLDELVQQHLDAHAGDIDASLAAVHDSGVLEDQLETMAGHDTSPDARELPTSQEPNRKELPADPPHASGSIFATIAPTAGVPSDHQEHPDPERADEQQPASSEPTKITEETQVGIGSASGTDSMNSLGRRFEFLRMHAKGGLGEIHVARDRELNREVALKEIQDHLADDAASRRRFIVEGEVTGSLEHPGVVPVYGMGADADGRPYYAMRLIRGESLKEAIADFHTRGAHDFDPGKRTLALHKLLRRFVDVCNTVHYAHSRGVLHRDLKPDNVMLGPYGETLVVDWGLAKVIGRDEELREQTDEVTLQPGSNRDGEQTQQGSVVGTLQYMSPEQALGWHNRLTPASDVFSLGAILYRLLTNKPLYKGRQLTEIHQQVIECNVSSPRQVDRTIPSALAAICKKALSKTDGDRYPTALKLAEDMEAYLADEPIAAAPEPFTLRARRWMRRHHTLVVTSLSTLLLGIIGLAGTAALLSMKNAEVARQRDAVQEQRDEVQRQKEEVQLQRDKAERLRAEAEEQRNEVQKQRDVAEASLRDSRLAVWNSFVKLSQDERLKAEGLSELRGELLNASAPFYEKFLEQNPNDPLLCFEQALWRYQLGQNNYQLKSRRDAFQETTMSVEILRKLVNEYPDNLNYQRVLASSLTATGELRTDFAEYHQASQCFHDALDIAEKLPVDFEPSDEDGAASSIVLETVPGLRCSLLVKLGEIEFITCYSQQAIDLFNAAREVEKQYRAQFPDDNSLVQNGALLGLANVQARLGDRLAAIELLEAALNDAEEILPSPREEHELILYRAQIHNHMGIYYSNMGRLHAARLDYDKAQELIAPLNEKHSGNIRYRELISTLKNNTSLDKSQLRVLHQKEDIVQDMLDAIAAQEQLSKANPDVPSYRLALSIMNRTLANHYLSQQKTEQAHEKWEQAAQLSDEILKRDSSNCNDLLSKIWNLQLHADIMSMQADYDAATDSAQQAVGLAEEFLEKRNFADFRVALIEGLHRLINIAYSQGDHEQSRKYAIARAKALSAFPDTVKQTPYYDKEHAMNLRILADANFNLGKPKEGFELQYEALEIYKRMVERFPDEPGFKFELSVLHSWITETLVAHGIDVYGVSALKKLVAHQLEIGKVVRDIDLIYLPVWRLEDLVQNENYLADYEQRQNNLEQTLDHLTNSLKFSQALYEIQQQAGYLAGVASAQLKIGDVEMKLDRNKAAMQSYSAALKTAERLLIQHGPEEKHARELRAQALSKQGELHYRNQDWKKSLIAFEQAVEIGGREDAIDPRIKRAMVHARLGDHETAALLATATMRLPRADATDFYNAACAYSLAIDAAEEDAKLKPEDRSELIDAYARKSIEMLQKAKNRGAFRSSSGLSSLRDDANLAAVRDRDEFKKLVEEVESALK